MSKNKLKQIINNYYLRTAIIVIITRFVIIRFVTSNLAWVILALICVLIIEIIIEITKLDRSIDKDFNIFIRLLHKWGIFHPQTILQGCTNKETGEWDHFARFLCLSCGDTWKESYPCNAQKSSAYFCPHDPNMDEDTKLILMAINNIAGSVSKKEDTAIPLGEIADEMRNINDVKDIDPNDLNKLR